MNLSNTGLFIYLGFTTSKTRKMTYYLKYRPQTLEELDISDVRNELKKIVSSGRIPHAFLFSGPKGTGKTSAARILAKILNCDPPTPGLRKGKEPCNKCDQCVSITKGTNLDVIELDAASHRGIDDARAIRDTVKLSPAKAKKKVYIIDEAHMLTLEASNALLKILEEPPPHVVFILATTTGEKLIETIRSRTTNLSFRKANKEEIKRSLERVVKEEKIKIDKEALESVAKASKGSFRDAVKVLEELTTDKKVKLGKKEVEEYLLKFKETDVTEFLQLLIQKKTKAAIDLIDRIAQKGQPIEVFLTQFIEKLRVGLLAEVGVGDQRIEGLDKAKLLLLIELFSKAHSQLRESPIEHLPVELAVIAWTEEDSPTHDSASKGRSQTESSEDRTYETTQSFTKKGIGVSEDKWKEILVRVRPINASIEALLRAAKPINYDGKILTLGVYYRFHKERLEDSEHRKILEEVAGGVLGTPTRISCILADPPAKQIIEEMKEETVLVESDSVLTEGGDKDIIKVAEKVFGENV